MSNSENSLQIGAIAIPQGVATLAKTLHAQRGTGLEIECAADISTACNNALYNIADGNLAFTSLEARNQCVAVLAYRDLCIRRPELAANEVFQIAHQLWGDEIGHNDSACGRFLALCHDKINILQAAATFINIFDQNVFDYLHTIQTALPFLPDLCVTDIVAISDAQYLKTQSDLTVSMFVHDLEKALTKLPNRAWELYEYSRSNATEANGGLYSVALMSLIQNGDIFQVLATVFTDIQSCNACIVVRALHLIAVAMTRHDLPPSLAQQCLLVLRQHSQHTNSEIQKSAVQAIGRAAERHSDLLADLLVLAQENAHPNWQHTLAVILHFLFFHEKIAMAHAHYSELLQTLCKLDVQVGDNINILDHLLNKLLLDPSYVQSAQSFWTSWMINHADGDTIGHDAVEPFPSTVSAIANQPELLATIITNWLGAAEPQLGSACGGLIRFLWISNFRKPVFAKAVLDAQEEESLIFLVRRMLGFIFEEEALLSLTFSLLKTDNAVERTHDLVYGLLTDEIGRDYLDAVLAQLAKRRPAATADEQKLFDAVSEALTTYRKNIEGLPRLAELRFPQRLRRAIDLRNAREMAASQAAADEKSIWHKIASKISIKAGNGTFYVQAEKISTPNMFQSHSVTVSLPGRYYSDPVNYDFSRRLFRMAKRGDK